MAITQKTRDAIILGARQNLNAVDSSKGGPTDDEIVPRLEDTIARFVAEAGALETVIKLSTKANDKYLPLVDEILWAKTVSFIDSDGRSYPLDPVEVAPRPGSIGGRPSVYWLTAVNVPDPTGKSTRTLGIDPAVTYDGNGNVILEAYQITQEMTAGSDYPEVHPVVQKYLPFALALDLLPMFPDRLDLEGYLSRQRSVGLDLFRKLNRNMAKRPYSGKDAMQYRRRARSRF